jgi:hypothetical protein
MTFATQEAADLYESIRKLSRQDQRKARESTAQIALAQLRRCDELVLAAAQISEHALALHDTVTAIREGKLHVADGTDKHIAVTLDDLKEESE